MEIQGKVQKIILDNENFISIIGTHWTRTINTIPNLRFHASEVISIEYSKGFISNPYLKFQVIGHTGLNHIPQKSLLSNDKGVQSAFDPYLVYFSKSKREDFKKFKSELENIVQKAKEGLNNSSKNQSEDIMAQIKKLKELLDDGILTQEEFDTKKKELLGRI